MAEDGRWIGMGFWSYIRGSIGRKLKSVTDYTARHVQNQRDKKRSSQNATRSQEDPHCINSMDRNKNLKPQHHKYRLRTRKMFPMISRIKCEIAFNQTKLGPKIKLL